MARWTAVTIAPQETVDPDHLHDRLTAQSNAFVLTDVVWQTESIPRLIFKLRGGTPGIAGRARDYCESLATDIQGVAIARVNNTTNTVHLEYYAPDDGGLRRLVRESGTLEYRPDDPTAAPDDTTYSSFIVPDRDALRTEYEDLRSWCAAEYGLRPIITYE